MCATCGCSAPGPEGERHEHEHGGAAHAHPPARLAPWPPVGGRRILALEQEVLGKNDRVAAETRAWLRARGIVALNVVSSPGAGKTTLLERTIRDLAAEVPIGVIEGDQETPLDADRIRATGCPAVQVNTGRGCHLDATMVREALGELDLPRGALLLVENVGNLVCPALFDLGERAKVVVASTPEGEEKPLKYPHMFRASSLALLNKIDLAPHLGFDAGRLAACARQVNPRLEVLEVSARRGDGLHAWYAWIRARLAEARAAPPT
ncbi:MAG TPA: hydrogenase nickel incorporation protein HypB [Anaeromyxobacteraceae bacterium]|nr:hydrogenase nickel incorporation protein HypB [Anaeromyxobacteraceae bacterium]